MYLSIYQDVPMPATKIMKINATTSSDFTCMAPSNPFVNSCYAVPRPCARWKNDVKTSTFHLSFNKWVVVNGDTLLPGKNFLEHALIDGMGRFVREGGCNDLTFMLELNEAILQKVVFDTGYYTAKFKCQTTDGKDLVGEVVNNFYQ